MLLDGAYVGPSKWHICGRGLNRSVHTQVFLAHFDNHLGRLGHVPNTRVVISETSSTSQLIFFSLTHPGTCELVLSTIKQ